MRTANKLKMGMGEVRVIYIGSEESHPESVERLRKRRCCGGVG